MDKERSLGVTIISKIEIVIGIIGLLYSLSVIILNLLTIPPLLEGEHIRISHFNGLLVSVILGVAFTTILITGKLTYYLKPMGRISQFFISVFIIICYILFLYLMKFDIKSILGDLLFDYHFTVVYIPLIVSIFLIYYFNHPKVKEQFK